MALRPLRKSSKGRRLKPPGSAGGRRARRLFSLALAGLTVATSAPAWPPRWAGASSLGKARAQAAALARQLVAEARVVHSLSMVYQQDQARVLALSRAVANSQQLVISVRVRMASTELVLRREAVVSYTGSVPVIPLSPAASVELTDSLAYLQVAVGDVQQTLQRFATEQSRLANALASLRGSLAGARRARRSAATARAKALAQAARLQGQLGSARGAVTRLAAEERAATGPPVGNGMVRAVAQQLAAGGRPPLPGKPQHAASLAGAARPLGRSASTRAASPGSTRPPTTTATTFRASLPASPDLATTTAPTTRAQSAPASGQATAVGPNPSLPATTAPVPTSLLPSTTVLATTSVFATTSVLATSTDPTTTTVPALTTAPPVTSASSTPSSSFSPATAAPPPPPAGGVWLELRTCESGNDYQANSGNGYYGAYQFSSATWTGLGYSGRPDQEPYWLQDEAAQRLEAVDGWGQWPACSAALGL